MEACTNCQFAYHDRVLLVVAEDDDCSGGNGETTETRN